GVFAVLGIARHLQRLRKLLGSLVCTVLALHDQTHAVIGFAQTVVVLNRLLVRLHGFVVILLDFVGRAQFVVGGGQVGVERDGGLPVLDGAQQVLLSSESGADAVVSNGVPGVDRQRLSELGESLRVIVLLVVDQSQIAVSFREIGIELQRTLIV